MADNASAEAARPRLPARGAESYRVPRSNTADALTAALRQMIMAGALKPGEVLRQERLASELGVSRTPLREALQRLASEGLVRLTAGWRGAIITRVTEAELLDLYELREVIETAAIRAVARRFTEKDYKRLVGLAAEGAACEEEQDWVAHNRAFHSAIYALSDKSQFMELIDSLGTRADVYVHLLANYKAGRSRADHDHFALLQALREHDEDNAAQLVRTHLRRTVDTVSEMVRERETSRAEAAEQD